MIQWVRCLSPSLMVWIQSPSGSGGSCSTGCPPILVQRACIHTCMPVRGTQYSADGIIFFVQERMRLKVLHLVQMRAVESRPRLSNRLLPKDKGFFSILIKLKCDRHATKIGQISNWDKWEKIIYFVVSINFFCQLSETYKILKTFGFHYFFWPSSIALYKHMYCLSIHPPEKHLD